MSKTFRSWDVNQDWLLPRSLAEFVPSFRPRPVRNELDLTAILSSYDNERGFPPYHPGMMVAVLLYAYTQGVYSSRRIARCCEERLDFMAVTAVNTPTSAPSAIFASAIFRHWQPYSCKFSGSAGQLAWSSSVTWRLMARN